MFLTSTTELKVQLVKILIEFQADKKHVLINILQEFLIDNKRKIYKATKEVKKKILNTF